jgi:hypothetical protein
MDFSTLDKIRYRLETLQPGIDEVVNPSQTDIKKHIKKLV